MTPGAADLAGRVRITEVWAALGGGTLRRNRGRAFWRDGDGYNVDLCDAKGTWNDFARGEGGGILDLIQRAQGGSRGEALTWLSCTMGLALGHVSEADRRRWAEAKRRAALVAQLAGAWLSERLRELEEEKAAAVDPNGGPWNTLALAAAAGEHHHLSTLDGAGVLKAWQAAREIDPAHTRELERIGLEWRAACERMAGMFSGFIQKGARADAA